MNTDKIFAEKLASEYASKEAGKVVALKKLDKKAKQPANIFAYTFGTICALILGTGMSLAMKVIGSGTTAMVIGIIIGLIGIAGVSVNYFIYKKIKEAGKKKYAKEIITLAEQIAKEDK